MDVKSLSPSALRLLQLCGEAYRRRYVEGERTSFGLPAAIGNATHKAAEHRLTSKRDELVLPSEEEIKDITSDAFEHQIERPDFEWGEDSMTSTAAKHQALDLSTLHLNELAPVIEPEIIEQRMEIEIPGYPLKLVGYADVIEVDGTVRDLKTRKRSPKPEDATLDIGLAWYSMQYEVIHGTPAPMLALDVLVKKKKPELVSSLATPHEGHDPLLRRIERATAMIQAGAYMPAEPGHWKCSEKFCDYYDDCPWGRRGRKTI